MEKIKVSIITVSYNSAKTIKRAIDSVVSQNYDNIEYVVVDGGSTDGTVEILKEYGTKVTKWISEPDKGIYDAMNKGISLCTGDLIGILNSDDCYHSPESISSIIKVYNENNGTAIIHANIELHFPNGEKRVVKPTLPIDRIKKGPTLLHPSVFVPQDIYKKNGVFNTNYKISADYELLLRFYLKKNKYAYVDHIITDMYAGGVSDNKVYKGFVESYKIMVEAGLNPFISFFYVCKRTIGTFLIRNFKS